MSFFSLLAVALQDPYVRTHDHEVREGLQLSPGSATEDERGGSGDAYPPVCSSFAAGKHGEAVPGGGTLSPAASTNPATIIGPSAGGARTAFVAQVNGAARNQGVFVHDGSTLTAIAMGCGALGGAGSTGTCGDPTPIGGTFSGFFTGTVFAPAVNAAGDVLFLADVVGGSSTRGLFLHRAATGTIVRVAVVGDASPLGGVFAMVGPGSLNASGSVAFLASGSTAGTSDVFLWDGASVRKIAAAGDPAPLGSTYEFLGTESFGFADGTKIPVGPVPDVDDAGNVVFRAITAAGRRGFVRRAASGTSIWLVRDLDPAPGGGTFFDFQAANVNSAGAIAFFADVRLGPTTFTSGWFEGSNAGARKVIAFGDPVGAGTCNGLAFSRNPMSFLDDDGNVILWTDVLLPGGGSRQHLVVGAPDGSLTVVAKRTDPTPLGGTYSGFDAWPSIDNLGRGAINAAVNGVIGVPTAHFLFTACAAAGATVRNGSGANASCFMAPPPVLGSAWSVTVDATAHPGATFTAVVAHAQPSSGLFVGAGEVLVDLASPRYFQSVLAGGGVAVHGGTIPSTPSLAGVTAALQGLILGGGAELCNAVDVVLGH
jgi:hypothetical protein